MRRGLLSRSVSTKKSEVNTQGLGRVDPPHRAPLLDDLRRDVDSSSLSWG